MIIWQGFGYLAIVIPFVVLLLMQVGVDGIAGKGYYTAHDWVQSLAVVIAALIVAAVGFYLNRQPGKVLIDPETNQKVEFRRRHTFFWIPLEYWAIIILAFAGFMAFAG